MKICREIKPPRALTWSPHIPSVFLAGSIEMDKAGRWQDALVEEFSGEELILLNPRREQWDASWTQSMGCANFRSQVEWELEGLERADLVLFYFCPHTKSPVSMLELGLCARDKQIIICCPDGFWRKGNVEIVAKKFNIPVVSDFEVLKKELRNWICKTYAKASTDSKRSSSMNTR